MEIASGELLASDRVEEGEDVCDVLVVIEGDGDFISSNSIP